MRTKKKNLKKIKYNGNYLLPKIIIFIFLAALLIRLSGVNNIMYNDEGSRAIAIRDSSVMENFVGRGTAQPPMYSWIVMSVTSVLGYSNFAFRLTHIVFGMLTIYLAFVFSKRYFGIKAATWTVVLMSFSYYHIVASVQITLDGSILAFFCLLTLYCFMRYFDDFVPENKRKAGDFFANKWLLLTGVSLGLAMLTKVSAVLLFPTIAAYSLVRTRKLRNAFFDTLVSSLVAALMFSVYLVLSLFERSGIEFLLSRASDVVAYPATNYGLLAIQFMQAMIWLGPLLAGLLLLIYISLLSKKERDSKTYLLFIFSTIVILFYIFVIKDNFRPVERYLMAITAPLCILSGAYLSRIRFERKHLYLFVSVLAIFLIFLFGLNIKQNDYIPFYPKEAFMQRAISFDWAVNVPLLGNEGPVGFYLSLDSIIYAFLISFLVLAIYITMAKLKKSIAVLVLVIFLGVSFAFNILMTEEYLFSEINPDIEKVSKEMTDYVNSNQLKKPLFFFRNFALEFYTTEKHGYCPYALKFWDECILDFSNENDIKKIELISRGGTVLVVDFPKINRESMLWKKFSGCKKLKSFYDKGQEVGFIVEC